MSEVSQKWTFFDQANVIHKLHCDSVQPGAADLPAIDVELAQTSEAVVAYGIGARRIYDLLKRIIGQTGGLLILAQASGKRDAVDLPSLTIAEDSLKEARDQLAVLAAPSRLVVHRGGMEEAARLTAVSLAALRNIRMRDGSPDLEAALDALSKAYKILQRASENRFGMMMVDFRHACCSCGAFKQ